ncbi:major facilitator family transporter [alpha proteobacterium U9-1i]|nr:major facilitator family transporter [alpha proteobacterium U9-1i]
MSDAVAAHPGYGTKSYRAYVLGVLLVVYTFNFIDRILIGIVGEDLKHDLGVSDFQLGLLGGPAFAILYTLLGIPIARYAERGNRITIVSIGAAVWSLMTALCGFANSFLQLVLARIGVGIGEAACIPPSHSAISDYFPTERRATALSIFALGIPIGTMMAAVGGGWLVQNFDWRSAFWLLGAPGLVAALILKLTVREPPRVAAASKAPSFGETFKVLASKPSFWHVAFAGALMSFVGYANAQFLVSFTVRNYGLSIAEASYAFGAIAGFAVAIGTFLGGFLGDRLSARHPRVLAWLPALGIAVCVPAYGLAFMQQSFGAAFAILMVAPIFHYLYLGPMFAVTQGVAEPRTRATAAALLLLIVNLIGYGLGPPTIGALADYFANQSLAAEGLALAACRTAEAPAACGPAQALGIKYALVWGLVVMVWAGVHFLIAGRTLQRDRVG